MKSKIPLAVLSVSACLAAPAAHANDICRDVSVEVPGDIRKEVYCMRRPPWTAPPIGRPAPGPGPGGGNGTAPPPAGSPSAFDSNGDGKLDCWKDAVGPATPGAAGRGSKTRISSPYGPSTWRPGSWHYGVDLVSRTGNFGLGQPVRAISDGVVLTTGTTEKNGNFVAISHPDGRMSKYLHLRNILAEEKKAIRAGDLLGTMNCTGSCGQGLRKNEVQATHVHIELLVSAQAGRTREGRIDPISLMGNCK
ncbi:MAG TPA: M23 family metallopeptidase [Stenotrophomonas sp.]|nr:M23 family metallopeptidase [Stenotrophomonas sp.]